MPDFESWDAASWSAMAAWMNVGILLVAALFAWWQVREARKLRGDQARPFVVIDFEPEPYSPFVDLVIENLGKTVARNVRFSFDRPLEASTKHQGSLSDMPLLKDGISTFPPGKRISSFFDSWLDRKDEHADRYTVTINYEDDRHNRFEERHVLDLTIYKGLSQIRRKGLHDISKTLESIQSEVAKWTVNEEERR